MCNCNKNCCTCCSSKNNAEIETVEITTVNEERSFGEKLAIGVLTAVNPVLGIIAYGASEPNKKSS